MDGTAAKVYYAGGLDRKACKYESHSGNGKKSAVKDAGEYGHKTYYGQNQRDTF